MAFDLYNEDAGPIGTLSIANDKGQYLSCSGKSQVTRNISLSSLSNVFNMLFDFKVGRYSYQCQFEDLRVSCLDAAGRLFRKSCFQVNNFFKWYLKVVMIKKVRVQINLTN